MAERGRAITGDKHWTRRSPEKLVGERNPSARLTSAQVLDIRAAYAAGATQVVLAGWYGITQGMVSQIIRRTAWAHLGESA